MYDSLINHNVPDKLIKLIKLTTQRTKMKVKVSDNYSEWFETKTVVREGDLLSALLFSVVLDSVITNLEVRGNMTTKLKQICAYADDIVIIGRKEQISIYTFCKPKHEALNVGLTVNNNKTKHLYCTGKIFKPTFLNTEEEQFQQVNSFKYLGSTDNSIEEEMKERTVAGNRAYHVYKKLFTSKLISRNVRLQLYNTLIRATANYASKKWVRKENMVNKLMIFERRIMRKIFGSKRTDYGYWRIKTNQKINEILKGQNIIGFIKKQRLNWLGHKTKYMVMSRDQNAGRIQRVRIDNSIFERVEEFKYLGTTLTNQNSIAEEINSTLRSGNACYHSVQNLLSSRLLNKNLKIKIYRTIILPVVLYGCET